jgi:hypothetical protein
MLEDYNWQLKYDVLICTSRIGQAMVQAVSRWLFTVEAQVSDRATPCEICGAKSDTETGFSPHSSVFSC